MPETPKRQARSKVKKQTNRYLAREIAAGRGQCVACGCADSGRLSVDHYPRSFADIWKSYLREQPSREGHREGDEVKWPGWRGYHQEHARYRLLCDQCHTDLNVEETREKLPTNAKPPVKAHDERVTWSLREVFGSQHEPDGLVQALASLDALLDPKHDMTLLEAADLLGVSASRVEQLLAEGKLSGSRVSIPTSAVLAFKSRVDAEGLTPT